MSLSRTFSRRLQFRDNVAIFYVPVSSLDFTSPGRGSALEEANFSNRAGRKCLQFFLQRLFNMIFEIAAVLFLVHAISVLSRLLARRRSASSYLSKLMHGARRRWARAARSQYPEPSGDFEVLFTDDRRSRFFYREDAPLFSPSARTDPQQRGVGMNESVCSGGAGSMSRKPLDRHLCERPSRQLFRPYERPSLGLRPRPELPWS